MSTDQWMFREDGVGDVHRRNSQCPAYCQPVAVISPEDREQVERLAKRYIAEFGGYASDVVVDAVQAALREFADPKSSIEEPAGRYAVVEDADGVEWLREKSGAWCYVTQQSPGLTRWRTKRWADIDVVRVLSEGVVA